MILDSRKGAKIRKEVEIPFTHILNSQIKHSLDSSDLCSKKKLISTRLFIRWTRTEGRDSELKLILIINKILLMKQINQREITLYI